MFLISPTETKDLSDYNGKLDSATRSEVHRKKRLEGTWTATSQQIFITAKAREGKTIATPYRNKQNLKEQKTVIFSNT